MSAIGSHRNGHNLGQCNWISSWHAQRGSFADALTFFKMIPGFISCFTCDHINMTTVVAKMSSARKCLFFLPQSRAASVSLSVVLIQVNCLLCIINFLLSPSLFLSPTFNHSFKGPLPRFRPPQCLLKVTAARVRGMLFEAATKKATHSRRLGRDKSLPLWLYQKHVC